MSDYPLIWIIMGIAGAGKTVVGRLLSARLDCDFIEGDRRHPAANIAKMQAGIPLQDEDRLQWLAGLEGDIKTALERHLETVITCSALKASYRRRLALPRVMLVWLEVPAWELARRLHRRSGHYFQSEMLDSQLAAVEPISPQENVLTVDGLPPPDAIVAFLLRKMTDLFPALQQPWWRRPLT
jgi:gluconokinase